MITVKEQNKGLAGLLPCPFCGQHAVKTGANRGNARCYNDECSGSLHAYTIVQWNKRALEPATEAVLEEARAQLKAWREHGKLYGFECGAFENDPTTYHIFQLDDALRPSPSPEPGMVMRWIPVEPTRDMERAGMLRSQENDIFNGVGALTFADCAKIYRAMVNAAPLQQPEVPSERS